MCIICASIIGRHSLWTQSVSLSPSVQLPRTSVLHQFIPGLQPRRDVCFPLSQLSVDSGRMERCSCHHYGWLSLFFAVGMLHGVHTFPSVLVHCLSLITIPSWWACLSFHKEDTIQAIFLYFLYSFHQLILSSWTTKIFQPLQTLNSMIIDIVVLFFLIVAGGPTNLVCTNVPARSSISESIWYTVYWKTCLSRIMPQWQLFPATQQPTMAAESCASYKVTWLSSSSGAIGLSHCELCLPGTFLVYFALAGNYWWLALCVLVFEVRGLHIAKISVIINACLASRLFFIISHLPPLGL